MSGKTLDPRVLRGMERQLELRRKLLADGERPLGWKIGFGSRGAMERFEIDHPLVGFLVQSARLPSESAISMSGWTKIVAEPEIAVYIGSDLPEGTDREGVRRCITAVGPAIELADVAFPPNEVEEILAVDIFQRHVILGRRDETRAGGRLDGLVGRVYRNGAEHATTEEPESLTGNLVENLAWVADLLASLGLRLRAGEVVITGSLVPPVEIEERTVVDYTLDPIDTLRVTVGP